MPRPKVPPHRRQRVVQACNACRAVRKRCSGAAPCTLCQRRGIGHSCSIPAHTPAANPQGVVASERAGAILDSADLPAGLIEQAPLIQTRPPDAAGSLASSTSQAIGPSHLEDRTSLNEMRLSNQENRPESPILGAKPQPRMLLNLHGERVFIGRGGSQSLLQCVRKIIASQIGPSSFSRDGRSEIMHETESPQARHHTSSPGEMSVETKLMYAGYFSAVTGGLIDPFCPQELETLLTTPSLESPHKKALAELVIAIGLQCELSADTLDRELAYFTHAQSHAFSGMLEEPDLDVVRIFLIMAFYLLGQGRRNTAFVYLGIAARIALVLGLHSQETYTDINDPKQQLRLRVWMSLRVMDIPISSVLGRPPATGGVHSDLKSLIDGIERIDHDSGITCLAASYKIVSLISSIVDRVYDRKEISISLVEEFLQKLKEWGQEVPEFLHTLPPSSSSVSQGDLPERKGAIGRVHVSCLYYFAVNLVTRPLLISTLTRQQPADAVSSQLASACLEAATLVVQTCNDAHKLNLLKANMSTLMTMIFPAGLVLGLELFAKESGPYGIEAAFHGARDLLGFLGAKSSLAALYHEMLISLWNVISERRTRKRSHAGNSYVSRIFAFDRPQTQDMRPRQEATNSPGFMSASQQDQTASLFTAEIPDSNAPLDSGEVFLDWDSLDITQWDTFPFIGG
ncbi:unnamed protein product [Clonostachys rhizophaga]|uniref:Zn(2)-C6 fungal-type domain-containing protein n=1 Tax=Clonostachys rhizophaga TaxID=160324 RepID=A0A9N9YQG7_9HYPO|nr:unnamed protein product [Clonostachys rhizophaga]